MSLKIPPRKIHLPVMDGIGADKGTNSLPKDPKKDAKSRFLKEAQGPPTVPGIETIEDLQDYRETTDSLLLKTDETLLRIASDQLFLPRYYSKANPVKKKIDNKLSPRKPRAPQSARGIQATTPRQPYTTGTVTARGPGAREEKEKVKQDENVSLVRLPAIRNRKGKPTKWHLRHQNTLELESEYDLLLAQLAAETEAKQLAQKGSSSKALASPSEDAVVKQDDESDDPLGATANRFELGTVGRLDSFQGSTTSGKDSGPWWDTGDLDGESKKRCRNALVDAPELCRSAIEDIQYRALEHVSKFRDPQQVLGKDENSRPLKSFASPETEGYDVMMDRKILELLGEGHLRDLMDALGFDPGPTTATAGIIASGSHDTTQGENLLHVAREADTGLDDILLDLAIVKKIPHSQLTVSLLEEDLLFFLDLKRLGSKKAQVVAVSRLSAKCDEWLKKFIEEKDSELRDSLL